MGQDNRLVSVVVIACNEAERIGACLESVDWADEVVVVDSGSTDETREIARTYTERVYDIPWRGFGMQKQAAVELASHDLVLNIDCDERVTPELAEEISEIARGDRIMAGYTIPRRTFLGTKEIRHCGWYPDRTVRLFDRSRAHFTNDLVHERVVVNGEVGVCKHHLIHFSFAGIGSVIAKLNRYSELAAQQMFEAGRRCIIYDLTVRPLFAFFKTFVLRKGFLDGVEGLVISVTTALLTFAKYTKLRELNNRNLDTRP